jgi:hypothetical protein
MATGRIPTTANSPLTVKGDLFGYSTTQARVPVGNDGETLVADSSTTTGLRYGANFAAGKNKIINGDFRINQRSFSSITATDYTFDRWRCGIAGDGTTTTTAQTFTLGAAPVAGYEGTNFVQVATTGQTNSTVQSNVQQRLESVRTFANETVTISFWAKAASGTPKIAIDLIQNFGTGGSPSSSVETYVGQVTLSTSWARYSVIIAVPSINGKTLGTTSGTDFLQLTLWTSAGSTFNARTGSLGIQTATIGIWGVQVEQGSTATAFQTATGTIQGELAACQRYLPAIPVATGDFAFGQAFSSTKALVTIPYFVQPRVAPTGVTVSAVASFALRTPTAGFTFATAITFNNATLTAANLEVTAGASFTAGQATTFYNSAGSLLFTGCEL